MKACIARGSRLFDDYAVALVEKYFGDEVERLLRAGRDEDVFRLEAEAEVSVVFVRNVLAERRVAFVVEYWKTLPWNSSIIRHADSLRASCGKEMGFGRPPANDMTDGSSVTLSMSLMKDEGVFKILSE